MTISQSLASVAKPVQFFILPYLFSTNLGRYQVPIVEILRDKAKQIKDEDNKQKYLDSFYKSYDKFYESLSSKLSNYDSETKTEIIEKLIQLVHLIEDTIETYLN